MSVRFDHVAIAVNDRQGSARFLSSLLGLPEPSSWGPFVSVHLDDGVHLDYAEPGIDFPGQHYALLVSDEVFDHALDQLRNDRSLSRPSPRGRRTRSTTTTAAGRVFR
jgi:catechol 2,3-dioxygenase-like lactoylglutathione lyase family enzyme